MAASPRDLFEPFDLTEYETTALSELLAVGRTTAPNLAETTGIPKARIYGVLDSLAESGYVKIIPNRPKEYQPKSPDELLERAIENRRQRFEQSSDDIDSVREAFLEEFIPLYEKASKGISPAEELFYVVDIGEPSERETRALYHEVESDLYVLTKGFEYFDRVESAFQGALDSGIDVNVLLLHPTKLSGENREIQETIIDHIRDTYSAVEMAYSDGPLPWRGTFVDPTMDYDAGKAIILVGERDTPLSMRQAAITENGSFVAGLKRFFDLVWEFDSSPVH